MTFWCNMDKQFIIGFCIISTLGHKSNKSLIICTTCEYILALLKKRCSLDHLKSCCFCNYDDTSVLHANSWLFVIQAQNDWLPQVKCTSFWRALKETFSLSAPTVEEMPLHTQTCELQSVSQLALLGACLRLKNKPYRHLVSEALCLYSSFQR